MCLRDPDAVPVGSLDYHINFAADELFLRVVTEWNKKTRQRATLDLVEGKDLVKLPPYVAELTHVWRLDLGDEPVPVVKVEPPQDWQHGVIGSDIWPWMGTGSGGAHIYVPMPDSLIRIKPRPESSAKDKLLIEFWPRFVPLEQPHESPMLPEEIHGAVVPLALLNLKQQSGADFADARTVLQNAARWEQRVTQWLTPSDRGEARPVSDESDFF